MYVCAVRQAGDMDYRKAVYEIEEKYLSPYAFRSSQTKGRRYPLTPCNIRTDFQRDRDRIIHSKAFRRLKHKTQVFLAPEGDHYRTRLTHTLEVSQIARTIARALRMNEDLTEAISLGHDLGHTPFGHAGERALNARMKDLGGFRHEAQSVRVADVLENMDLTSEVLNGIGNHSRRGHPDTLEGEIVRLSDQIAYLNHDVDDAIRAGVLSANDLPQSVRSGFGDTHGKRIDAMISDIIRTSYGRDFISASEQAKELTEEFRDFMFERVYFSPVAKAEEGKVDNIVLFMFEYYLAHESEVPEYIRMASDIPERRVCDYIATMTDNYLVRMFEKIYVPKGWALL